MVVDELRDRLETHNTVFPGIQIQNVYTKESLTVDGNDDFISFLGDGADKITPEIIDKRLGSRDYLVYDLAIDATTRRAAMVKARSFVRLKNPFEPSLINVFSIKNMDDRGVFNTYQISVEVAK